MTSPHICVDHLSDHNRTELLAITSQRSSVVCTPDVCLLDVICALDMFIPNSRERSDICYHPKIPHTLTVSRSEQVLVEHTLSGL